MLHNINRCKIIVPLRGLIKINMKKALFIVATCAIFTSCSSEQDPTQTNEVTFTVNGMEIATERLAAPAALIDDENKAMTDLYLFDGKTQVAHQTSTDANFGTITALLSSGEHNLHFVATRSTGLAYTEETGTLGMTSIRQTYGKHYPLSVSGSSTQNITLDRISGQVVLTIEDKVPADANELTIAFGDHYPIINVETFNGVRDGAFSAAVSLTGKVGSTNTTYTINVFTPTFGTSYNTTYTITATNTSGAVIGQATGTMPVCANTKTLLHGNLFAGTQSVLTLSTAWNADNDVNF